jgi:DNA-directed RNA polymerase subunit beta'
MTQDAVEDVKKMVPTQILKSTTSHDIQYFPRLDALLGLYKLSDVGNRTAQRYSKASDLLSAFKAGKVDLEDIVKLEGKDTTAGRALVAEGMPEDDMRNKVLYDLDYRLDNKGINKLLHFYTPKPDQFKRVAEHINALGFTNASGTTVSLADLKTLTKMRDDILKRADIKASHISARDPNRNDKLVEIYMAANEELKKGMDGSFGKHNPNMLYTAYKAGAKVKWDNVRQILATPMIVTSAGGVPIPIPIRHSYAEGLDSAEYWIASHGSRKSMYDRTMEASLPGAINKQLTNVAMNMVITEKDCGSRDGVLRPVDAVDIVDRYLAAPVKLKNGVTLTTNTPLTSGVIAELKKSKVSSVMVRSPLRCRAHQGLCQHDYGLGPDGKPPMVGENVGVAASAAFGERGVQLALRAFHDAGVHKGKNLMNAISRVRQIVNMPEILPDSAILATEAGTVTKVERDPAGGHRVFIGADDHYIPYGRELIVKPGDKVQKGRPMTRGPINPHELLELGGIKAVQHYMTDALDEIYSKENVRRVHSEVIVKTLTNIGKVVDPGDNDNYLHSDLASVQAMDSWNKENPNKKPIKYEAVLKGAEILPLEQTEDWLARLAYRRPGETLSRGTVEGWVSQLHGTHPVPGAVTGAEFGKPPKGEKGPY